MRIEVSQQHAIRLATFSASAQAMLKDQAMAYSPYWEHHAGLLNVVAQDRPQAGDQVILALVGDSGLYVPPLATVGARLRRSRMAVLPRHLYRRFVRGIKADLRIPMLTFRQAFDAVMAADEISEAETALGRIQHRSLSGVAGVFASRVGVEKDFHSWTGRLPNDLVLMSYYYNNLLCGLLPAANISTVLEIGGGSGNLASLLMHQRPGIRLILVDLPETIEVAFAYLAHLFPDRKIVLPNEVGETFPDTFDVLFLTPDQTSIIPNLAVDLAVNTDSFQEMTQGQIGQYFELIERCTHTGSWILIKNRVEKVPVEGRLGGSLRRIPPNRFADYPWPPNWEDLAYEICRFDRLVQPDDAFIRISRVVSKG